MIQLRTRALGSPSQHSTDVSISQDGQEARRCPAVIDFEQKVFVTPINKNKKTGNIINGNDFDQFINYVARNSLFLHRKKKSRYIGATFRRLFLCVLMFFGSLSLTACDDPGTADAGRPELAQVVLDRLDGRSEPLSRYTGKTIVLNIWATWCPPCRDELPALDELQSATEQDGFVVMGLSVDKDRDMVREFILERGVEFTQYIDSEQRISKGLLNVTHLPTTVIIDKQMRIVSTVIGPRSWSHPKMIQELRLLTNSSGV